MRSRLLASALAGLCSILVGCRSHIHAGGGQGFDAGAAVGPVQTSYIPPPPGPPAIIPDSPPPR